jgi:hypothetical protein
MLKWQAYENNNNYTFSFFFHLVQKFAITKNIG